ncbi:MAG: LLM class flavin-dependent oxidoreductase [Caulobacterales bacterium]
MRLSVLDQAPICEGMAPPQALLNSIDLAKLADQLGFDRYWVAEHHGMPSVASPAPEVLLARIGAETKGIRIGSGGVMLPHYAPLKVVEQFAMLEAMYPGRIDLGLGRAPGGSQLEALALMRRREQGYQADDFVQQFAELRAFMTKSFPSDHYFRRINISPATPGNPEVWLLGSSMWSSQAAAQWGLPFAFAHFFGGNVTREAFEHYRSAYKPSDTAPEPHSMMAIGVICADTDEEAAYLTSSVQVLFSRLTRGNLSPIPSPETALAEIKSGLSPVAETPTEFPRFVHGTPDKVKAQLEEIAESLKVDEVIAITIVHDHKARRRSYQKLAEVFGLTPRY